VKAGDLLGGRYVLRERIGSGATGTVWSATQEGLEREVAIKILHRHAEDLRGRLRFEREARVASKLAHPGVVAVYDFGREGERSYLVMELVRGETLRARLGAVMPVAEALRIGRELAEVLAAAHAQGLVHRDLKPENVVLGERARVLDFGLAFATGGGADGRMTAEGVVAGTPQYLSPEQARGEETGPPTDVYALGCVLYEMLAGAPPFGGGELDVLTKHLFGSPPPLRDRIADRVVPADLEELVMQMLAKRGELRPAAEDVVAALVALGGPERKGLGAGRRRERMLPATQASPLPIEALEVAIVGAVGAELLLGLSANGLQAFVAEDTERCAGAAAIYAAGAEVARVAELAAHGAVVADAESSDLARLTELLRAGALEVVPTPVTAAELARRLRRAARRGRR